MIAIQKTNNTGKLLVAVMAMALIIAGVAVMTSDNVNAAEGDVAKIGDVSYDTLDAAIDAAESGDTITLLGEATLTAQTIGKNIIIDGDEKVITVDGTVYFTEDVTFQNVTIKSANATTTAVVVFAANYNNGVTMTFDNVTFDTGINTVYVDDGNSAVFEGCTFTSGTIAYAHTDAVATPSITLNETTGAPDMSIQDTVSDSSVTIGENIVLKGTALGTTELYSNTTITIPQGETLTAESIAPAAGQSDVAISVLGTLNANVEAMPEKSITSTPDATINGQTGTWDVGYIGGDFSSNVDGAANQRIIVERDLTLKGTQYLKIQGELIVEEGVTLTITENAFVELTGNANAYIYGEVIVDETFVGNSTAFSFKSTGTLTIDGSMTLDAANAFDVSGKTVINGTFTVSENASAVFAQTTVSTDGAVEIYGEAKGKITNNGSISIDTTDLGTTGSDMLSIQMGIDGNVDIINLVGWVEVSDSELTFNYQNTSKNMENDNVLRINSVRGVSVSESVTYKNDETEGRIGTNVMVVSGTMIPGDDGTDTKIAGAFGIVAGSYVTLGENTAFEGITVNVNGNLDVPVDVMANTEGTQIAGTGTITISGSITAIKPISTTTVNAAMYETEKTTANPTPYYVYTTLEKALASGAEKITVTGKITVKESVQVPVGTTVTANGATIVIDEAVTMDVLAQDKSSGVINEGNIEVDGTLTFQNNSKGNKAASIISDTSKESDPAMTYTNIYNALENAADGETVEITSTAKDGVLIDRDVEVKTGVTLSVPNGKMVTVDYGATVTINGTANIVGTYQMNTVDPDETDGKTVVNGMFIYSNGADYTNEIAGAYFMYNGANAISPLSNVATLINDVQGNNVTVYGKNTVSDIAFEYTGDFMTIVVNADAVLSAGTLDLGAVGFQADGCFTGTLAFTNGSVVLNQVKGISASDVVTYDGDAQVFTATVTGKSVAYGGEVKDGKGTVSIIGQVASSASYGTDVTVTVPADATLTTTGGNVEYITVEGTVKVSGSTGFTIAVVLGTLNVDLNKIVTVDTLYAGVSVEDGLVSNSTAAVIGEGVTIGTDGIAYVGPEADVNDKVLANVADNKTTEYYVEDALYVTAYAFGDNTGKISDIKADLETADFVKWLNEKGDDVSATAPIGASAKVYAELNYNICDVKLSVLPGAIVYIDGQAYNGGKISVGEHTINVYLDSGFTGEPVITVNGQTVANGGTFTASTDSVTEISVTGIAAGSGSITVNTGSDDMSLTDILLIVLVVLIVIMAVIVALRLALRLMRS